MKQGTPPAVRILPLLESIAREIQERSEALGAIERGLRRRPPEQERHQLVAAAATHKRELRHVEKELDRLGCSLASRSPLTFRIRGLSSQKSDALWQASEPIEP